MENAPCLTTAVILLCVAVRVGVGVPQPHGPAQTDELRDLRADTWVATDALGRSLPTGSQTHAPRDNRFVGIFYFVWQGAHGTQGPFDISKIIENPPGQREWGPKGSFHHWGEPQFGYYLADDRYVQRRHGAMLANAKVDVAVIDVTNAVTYDDHVITLFETWKKMRERGTRTPAIAFLTHSNHQKVVRHLYNRYYKPGKYRELWFFWRGKPLIMSSSEGLSGKVRDFFTFRESWAWSDARWFGDGHHKWPWVDHTPQKPGWHRRGVPEEVPVAAAEHPVNNIGRSYHDGRQPPALRRHPERGIYFREQWNHALRVDPQFVFITGWNEWVAQRFVKNGGGPAKFLGRPLQKGRTYFVDQYNQEYSRDIEPMRGGHGANYYYQMVANIRAFKGSRGTPAPTPPKSVRIDGNFGDWTEVGPEFRDTVGDPARRDHPGWGHAGPYVNRTGRNDFETLKVANDSEAVYFYAETSAEITSPAGTHWMLLYINADCDPSTGWQGYDFLVNRRRTNHGHASLEEISSSGETKKVEEVPFAVAGKKLELRIPVLSEWKDGPLCFDFHWADNVQKVFDVHEFAVNGDSAPNRRFNYRFDRSGDNR